MSPRGAWRYLMPVFFMMSHSVIYEIIEWIAAEVFRRPRRRIPRYAGR